MTRRRDVPGVVYLVHFLEPIGNLDNPRGQASHYIGWSADPANRAAAHTAGQGSAIMRAVTAAGVGFFVARSWPGTRALERQLKRAHQASKFCPVCSGQGRLL